MIDLLRGEGENAGNREQLRHSFPSYALVRTLVNWIRSLRAASREEHIPHREKFAPHRDLGDRYRLYENARHTY